MDSIQEQDFPPPPLDYRDLPNLFTATAYQMDVDKLKARLKRARLILGLVEETVRRSSSRIQPRLVLCRSMRTTTRRQQRSSRLWNAIKASSCLVSIATSMT